MNTLIALLCVLGGLQQRMWRRVADSRRYCLRRAVSSLRCGPGSWHVVVELRRAPLGHAMPSRPLRPAAAAGFADVPNNSTPVAVVQISHLFRCVSISSPLLRPMIEASKRPASDLKHLIMFSHSTSSLYRWRRDLPWLSGRRGRRFIATSLFLRHSSCDESFAHRTFSPSCLERPV